MTLTANQVADALRQCGGTIVCEGCPYQSMGTAKCIQQMQKDAAEMIDQQAHALAQLRRGTGDE